MDKGAQSDASRDTQRGPAVTAAAAAQPGLEQALTFLQQGNLDRAESIYRALLEIQPDQAEALHLLGMVQAQRQNLTEAAELIGRSILIAPDNAQAHLNRGNVLKALNKHEEALASYDRAQALSPGGAEALRKRCATLVDLKRYEEALACCNHLLARDSSDLAALFTRGEALIELMRYADAVDSFGKALAIKPDFVDALHFQGIALWGARRYDEAVASYDGALALYPNHADAYYNRGMALACLSRHAEALASYELAIACNPEYAEAFNSRACLLAGMKRHDEALANFDRALAISPCFTDALGNRGGLFREMRLHERAAMDFSRLLELVPDYDYALGAKFSSDQHACNWKKYHVTRRMILDAVHAGRRADFPMDFVVMSDSSAEQLRCARTYAAHRFPVSAHPLWTGERYQHERIRIAYLSADFHDHATAYLMAELFEKHDRKRFEVSGWSFGPDTGDDMRKRLHDSFDSFNDVRQVSDVEVALMLRAQEIDIAVDLKGYTQDSRTAIFSHKAVPIQVNYLVYPGTIGADYMDYIIGDPVVIPQGHEAFYAEKVVRLPDSYQVNDSRRVISHSTPSRREVGLPETGFVFCCFNRNYKIVPEVFDIWMHLLQRVAGSVLWLFDDSAAAVRNLRAEAESRGVRADRLVFAPHMPLADHLARHRLADLFLDTLPCNAHTTASDALWAGLPVLTCLGNAFPGRVAASLLHAIGLPELITENLGDYEALAYKLAKTPTSLADIRARLARNKTTHPLFDTDRSTRHVESAYVTMYEHYQRGEPPQGFSVQPLL